VFNRRWFYLLLPSFPSRDNTPYAIVGKEKMREKSGALI
jgi:hypothetical protein